MKPDSPFWQLILFALFSFFLTACFRSTASCPPGNCRDSLTAEQKQLATQMIDFVDRTEKRFFEAVDQINADNVLESRTFQSDKADFHVQVARGSIIEKAGLMLATTKRGTPPLLPDAVWNRYVEIDIHPRTPLVGLLHITVNLYFAVDGSSTMGGWIDLIPSADREENLQRLKEAVDEIFGNLNTDPTPYRDWLCASLRKETVNTSCTGVSFYKRPMLAVSQGNFDLVTKVFDEFLETYLAILVAEKDKPYSEADLKAQNNMRKAWLKDHLVDPYPVMLVPPEVWFMAHQAPVIEF